MGLFHRIRDALGFGPTLRCKPGDICFVEHFDAGDIERYTIGCVVQVESVYYPADRGGRPFWALAQPLIVHALGRDWEVGGISDRVLRPIRNPGDEERDEMLDIAGPAPAIKREPAKAET